MTAYRKINGAWTAIAQPWVKAGAVWEPIDSGWVNDGSIDRLFFQGDTTPPDPPTLSIEFDESDDARYINVGVRLPDATHDDTLKRIRVLVSMGTSVYPASPLSSGYYDAPATLGGKEPWSDWHYNNLGIGSDGLVIQDNRDSSVYSFKKFAPTYKSGDKLPRSKRINFRAWAQDKAGNWSEPVSAFLTTPKSGSDAEDDYERAALVLPERVGTLITATGVFVEGVARVGPGERAFFDYGERVMGIIGSNADIRYSHIRLSRAAEDGGAPVAKQRGGRHGSPASGPLLETEWLYNYGDSSTLNAISKGQTALKRLPANWENNLDTAFTGFSLYQYSGDRPGTIAEYKSQIQDPNQGALLMRWEEDD